MSWFHVGGSLPPNFPSYIKRAADDSLYESLKEGHFCYVLTSRQMGKSSLRVQVMNRLQVENHAKCVFIDLTSIATKNISAEKWYYSFAYKIANPFGLDDELRAFWNDHRNLTHFLKLGLFIEQVLLEYVNEQIIIFIDEIDVLLGIEHKEFSTDDFFAGIRSFYNQRADNKKFNRITFALFGVATPDELMSDSKHTPFNIGEGVRMENFTYHESKPFLTGLAIVTEHTEPLLQEVLGWTSGHPFLTQKLCNLCVNNWDPDSTLTAQVANLAKEYLIDSDYVSNIKKRIVQNSQYSSKMLNIYQRVLNGEAVYDNESDLAYTYLELTGLVRNEEGVFVINNKIYEHIFDTVWIEDTLNDVNRPFAAALIKWTQLGRNSDALLRGSLLEDYARWAQGREDLSEAELAFLDASRDLEKKQIQNQRKLLIAIASGLAVAILFIAFSWWNAIQNENDAIAARDRADSLTQVAQYQRDLANQFQRVAELERDTALSAVSEANRQTRLADNARQDAEDEKNNALFLRSEAEIQRREAEIQRREAERQREIANSLRMRDRARYLASKAPFQANDTLALLLARQAYMFTTNRDITDTEVDLYEGLFNSLRNSSVFLGAYQNRLYTNEDWTTHLDYNSSIGFLAAGDNSGNISLYEINNALSLEAVYPPWLDRLGIPPPYNTAWIEQIATQEKLPYQNQTLNNDSTDFIYIYKHSGSIQGLFFDEAGDFLFSTASDNLMCRWSIKNRLLDANQCIELGASPRAMAFSYSNNVVTVGLENGHIVVFRNNHTLDQTNLFQGEAGITTLEFDPSGNQLYASNTNGTIEKWSLFSGISETLLQNAVQNAPIKTMTIDPQGNVLMAGLEDGTVHVWDISDITNSPEMPFPPQESAINSIEFSPDGKYIAMGSGDGSVKLWQLEFQNTTIGVSRPIELRVHSSWVLSISFLTGTSYMVSSSADQDLIQWYTDPEDMAEKICTIVERDLTEQEWALYVGDEPTFEEQKHTFCFETSNPN